MLTSDVPAFLASHDDAEQLENGKIRCTLTGHEMATTLAVLEAYWNGKSYRKRKAVASYDFAQHEPHLVQHPKSEHLLYCNVTRQPVSRQPHTVEAHVNGKRFKRLRAEQERKEEQPPPKLEAGEEEEEDDEEFDAWRPGGVGESSEGEPEAEEDVDAFWVRGSGEPLPPQAEEPQAGKKASNRTTGNSDGADKKASNGAAGKQDRKRPLQEQPAASGAPQPSKRRPTKQMQAPASAKPERKGSKPKKGGMKRKSE